MLLTNYKNRMLSDVMNEMLSTSAENSYYNSPAVNISEGKEDFKIEIAAPGLTKDQLKVELNKDSLIVFAESDSKDEQKYLKREFNYKTFRKVYHVPEKVDKEKIAATYTNGIFTITLPKREEAIDKGPVKIAIS